MAMEIKRRIITEIVQFGLVGSTAPVALNDPLELAVLADPWVAEVRALDHCHTSTSAVVTASALWISWSGSPDPALCSS